jgi:hypothetical protein
MCDERVQRKVAHADESNLLVALSSLLMAAQELRLGICLRYGMSASSTISRQCRLAVLMKDENRRKRDHGLDIVVLRCQSVRGVEADFNRASSGQQAEHSSNYDRVQRLV